MSVVDFDRYQEAKAETEAAYQKMCYAQSNLENKKVKERLAECRSQHDPLNATLERLGFPFDPCCEARKKARGDLISLLEWVVRGSKQDKPKTGAK